MEQSEFCFLVTERSLEFEKLIVHRAEYTQSISSTLFKCLQAVKMDKDIPLIYHEKETRVSR